MLGCRSHPEPANAPERRRINALRQDSTGIAVPADRGCALKMAARGEVSDAVGRARSRHAADTSALDDFAQPRRRSERAVTTIRVSTVSGITNPVIAAVNIGKVACRVAVRTR